MTGEQVPSRIHPVVPEGWFVKQSWTLLQPDGNGNVIVSVEPLAPDIDLSAYALRQAVLLQNEFPGYTELLLTEIMTPQGPVPLRVFEWTPPNGVPVRQHQMYWAEPGLGYCATATAPVTVADRHDDAFFAVLSGTRLGELPG